MKLPPAPHIRSNKEARPHGLRSKDQIKLLKHHGVDWLRQQHGIVVYANDQYPRFDFRRIILTPRWTTLTHVPGFRLAPPPELVKVGAPGSWVPIDRICAPHPREGEDFYVTCIHRLRRDFYEARIGTKTGKLRAFDIWPQGSKVIWPWEADVDLA